jgi:hypothetical protein
VQLLVTLVTDERQRDDVVSLAERRFGGLYFCGMYVSPAGMLREIGIEATRISRHIDKQTRRSGEPAGSNGRPAVEGSP